MQDHIYHATSDARSIDAGKAALGNLLPPDNVICPFNRMQISIVSAIPVSITAILHEAEGTLPTCGVAWAVEERRARNGLECFKHHQ